jgi:glycine/D-amino acid oxidase-like deaminating enzyme
MNFMALVRVCFCSTKKPSLTHTNISFQFFYDRLIHPLSPRGKLVHWGMEGLAATNRLIAKACETAEAANHDSCTCSSTVVLRDELYRIAANEQQVLQLQQTATQLPAIAEWLDANEIMERAGGSLSNTTTTTTSLGGLRLHNGCCVVHVPSYLKGLWKACQQQAAEKGCSVEWCITQEDTPLLRQDWDVTVYCGGAGMFAKSMDTGATMFSPLPEQPAFPVQLVRGQSLELLLPYELQAALLCGKYISPVPNVDNGDTCRALVGATHEFQPDALSRDQVIADLSERTLDLVGGSSSFWDDAVVERVTTGVRVQSARGKYGRRPIAGRLAADNNAWILTGLSSRGLLYHAIYADILADAILQDCEQSMLERCPDVLWWK